MQRERLQLRILLWFVFFGLCSSPVVEAGGLLKAVYDDKGSKECDPQTGTCPEIKAGDVIVAPRWKLADAQTIKWQIHLDQTGPAFSTEEECRQRAFCGAVLNGFQSWESDSNVKIKFEFGGSTPLRTRPLDGPVDAYGELVPDGVNLISFENDVFRDFDLPDEVLAITFIYFNNPLGQITDADVFFNPKYNPATRSIPPTQPRFTTGDTNSQYDVQSIAVHEIGHVIGLAHSIVRGAIMYPMISFTNLVDSRKLKADDRAWAGFLYPSDAYKTQMGVIRGRVIDGLTGGPFYGAHVMAFPDQAEEAFAQSAAGNLAISGGYSELEGAFILPGIPETQVFLVMEGLDGEPEAATPSRVSALLDLLTQGKTTTTPTEFYDGPGIESNKESALAFSPQGVAQAAIIQVKPANSVDGVELITNYPPSQISKVIVAGDVNPADAITVRGKNDKPDIQDRLGQNVNEGKGGGGGCLIQSSSRHGTRDVGAFLLTLGVIVSFFVLRRVCFARSLRQRKDA